MSRATFLVLFFISQIFISFKKYLKGSKAMSNISFLANFKNWSDFKISLITLFVNLSTCCTNSWNLSFSLQVHALITFITGWTKLESYNVITEINGTTMFTLAISHVNCWLPRSSLWSKCNHFLLKIWGIAWTFLASHYCWL